MTDQDHSLGNGENETRRSNPRIPYWNTKDEDQQRNFVEILKERFSLNFEYIAINCVVAILLIIAFLTDQLGLIILAILIAPPVIPIYSFAFGISLGSFSLVWKAMITFFSTGILFFSAGLFSGFISSQIGTKEIIILRHFEDNNPVNFVLIIVGLLFAFALILRNPKQSISVANAALAFIFYLPITAFGISIVRGDLLNLQSVIFSFLTQFIFSIFLGVIILYLSGVKSNGGKKFVPIIFISVILVGSILLIFSQKSFTGINNVTELKPTFLLPQKSTSTPSKIMTGVNSTIIATIENTQDINPSVNLTPTFIISPTNTPTVTLTPLPTPVWAEIMALESNGVNLRAEPGYNGKIISTLLNGTLVEVLPEVEVADNNTWVRIRILDQTEGWIVRDFLISSTPAPDW